jgi:predicted transcriptional regulator
MGGHQAEKLLQNPGDGKRPMTFDVEMLKEKLGMEPLNGIYNKEIKGVFVSDMVSDVMNGAEAGNIWVTVQTHKNIIAAANLVDVSAIIVTRGKSVPKETLDIANRAEISLFSTPLETYELAAKLYQAGVGIN